MAQADRYAVMGNPVSHSKSPRIHAMFAKQTGQRIDYRAIHVERGGFADAVQDFRQQGGRGLNVTVPFKQEAFELADSLSPRARRAGAVNTLVLDTQEGIAGHNTDGVGLVEDITGNHRCRLAGQRVLLVGAGGAARGVVGPLLDEGLARLVIANRTEARAVQLAAGFADMGKVEGCGFGELDSQRFDIIINATAASLGGEVPDLPTGIITRDTLCYDMMYADEPTAFMRWATDHGAARAVDGLGMLVEQAAESFYVWRGVRPKTGPVIARLRKS